MNCGAHSLVACAMLLAGCAAAPPPVDAPTGALPEPQLTGAEQWTYVRINPYNKLVSGTVTETLRPAQLGYTLTRASDRAGEAPEEEAIAAPWRVRSERLGPEPRAFGAPLIQVPFPLAPGVCWSEAVAMTDVQGYGYRGWAEGCAQAWERVHTPAGAFNALKVYRYATLGDRDYRWNDTSVTDVYWYAPEVKRWVRHEMRYDRAERSGRSGRHVIRDWVVWELKDYRAAP
ncbi:MAG: hypothetical protein HY017_11650 [Betaproteobacteria bacterium]|nr:hypothetical protein [Betaproteobacteria bacterium]